MPTKKKPHMMVAPSQTEQASPVAALRRGQGEHHEQRAEQQQRGAEGDEWDLDDRLEHLPRRRFPDLVREGPGSAEPALLVDQVIRDQRREEEAFRTDEGPDRQLPAVESGRGLEVCSVFSQWGSSVLRLSAIGIGTHRQADSR